MDKIWNWLRFRLAYLFAPRYLGVDYGNYDEQVSCVWFVFDGKVYVIDIIKQPQQEKNRDDTDKRPT